jgi:putative cell wall-binding protein
MVGSLLVIPGTALGAAPVTAPTIVAPIDGSSVGSANPTLQWTAVSGAARYKVQVSTSPAFTSTLWTADTYSLHATPPSHLPLGTVYWRVAGEDMSVGVGPYASASFYKEIGAAPVLVTPTDTQTLTFPTEPVIFSWQPVPGALSYSLMYDDASDFVGALTKTTDNTSYTLTDTQSFTMSDGVTPQSWYWKVRAQLPGTLVTEWSLPWSYQVVWTAAPQLQTPTHLSTITETVFSWDPVPGAQSYQIQVSPNGDWQNNKIIDATSYSTRYAPYPTLDNQAYYWRVRARATGTAVNYGPWSTEFQFTREWSTRPVTISPHWPGGAADPPIVGSLELSWTPAAASGDGWVDHASYYEVWIGTDRNFSPGTYKICTTNHTIFTPYSDIEAEGAPSPCSLGPTIMIGTTYYWRVRAIDDTNTAVPGVLGLWDSATASDTQRFIYIPSLPDPSCGPADGASVETPVLCWSASSGAERYRVTINKAGGAQVAQVTTYALSYTPTMTLNPADGPFSWHVETLDGQSNIGLQVASKTFNLVPPVTDTSFTLLSPTPGLSSLRMPSMTWKPYTGAAYYKVRYGSTPPIWVATPLSGGTKLPFAGFTYDALTLSTGRYYWYVEAYTAGDVWLADSAYSYFDVVMNGAEDWIIPWDHYVTPECEVMTNPYPTTNRCTPQLGDTQRLSWVPEPNAGSYIVYVAKDKDFTNIYRRYVTNQTTLTPRESWLDSQAGKSYYWFVRPCLDWAMLRCGPGADGNAGLYNASAYRKISPPVTGLFTTTATNPPVTATTIQNQITFNWDDYILTSQAATYPVPEVVSSRVTQEAMEYQFQVSISSDFSTLLDTVRVDQTQYTPWNKTYPEGPLYWRVQAIDGSNNALTMSATGIVTKASPLVSLTSPADGAIVAGLPYFRWEPQTWAAKYNIEVYKDGDLNFSPSNRVANATTSIAAWSPTTGLPSGNYAWRVQRLDVGNLQGPWSVGRLFALQPAAPGLNTPADFASVDVNDMYFTWNGVANAASYRFQTSITSTFTTTIESQSTVMTAWAPTRHYDPGTYYWRVSVLDKAGTVVLSTSGYRTFYAVDPNAAVTLEVGGLASPRAPNVAGSITVTARDSVGDVSTRYTGRIHFTSTDPAATKPGDYTFTTGDAGVHTFSVTLKTEGTWSVTATDTVTASITGSQTGIVVVAKVVRYSGAGRFATSADISSHTFPGNCGCVAYIAYAYNFPDALAGAAAAGTVKGPVLLVNTTGAIDGYTAAELNRLKPTKIIVLGSEGVVSAQVMSDLIPYAGVGGVVRYSGAGRFATAADISFHTFADNCGCVAYIAYAYNFPDALAGAAAAGTIQGPVLLVNTSGTIDTNTAGELTRLQPTKIIVLGSEGVVSANVATQLGPYAGAGGVVRYSGAGRFATAADISSHTFAADCGCVAYVAYAYNFPDALAGAAAAGTIQGPVLLVNTSGTIDPYTAAELTRLQPTKIIVLGSTGVISTSVFNALAAYVP